jgi:hypothetical protein
MRLRTLVLVTLSVLVGAKGAAGQTGRLGGLDEIRVVVESLGESEDKTGLNRGNMTIHTLALLKDKVPRLIINGTAESFIYINTRLANPAESGSNDYYGAVWIGVYRPVIIKKTGLPISAMVWYRARGVTGTVAGANTHIQQTLERILTQFATDWLKDNPKP